MQLQQIFDEPECTFLADTDFIPKVSVVRVEYKDTGMILEFRDRALSFLNSKCMEHGTVVSAMVARSPDHRAYLHELGGLTVVIAGSRELSHEECVEIALKAEAASVPKTKNKKRFNEEAIMPLQLVVNLPYLQVFADSERPSLTTVMELLWLGEAFHGQRIRLEGIALAAFKIMLNQYPPATLVRQMFTQGGFRERVLATSGVTVLKPNLVAV